VNKLGQNEASGMGRRESLAGELRGCWERLPNKGLFVTLLAGWAALFHLAGNSTLGYVRSPSLFAFMLDEYGDLWAVPLLAVLGLYGWKRKELLGLPLGWWPPGLLLIGLGAALHVFAFLVQQPKLSIIAMWAGLYGVMGLAWGAAWLRRGFFPFFLLVLCVPLGELASAVTFHLRLLTCQLVDLAANYLLAIDVERQGTVLINPAGHYQYEVEAACSGLRSLIATVGLALVLAFVWFRAWWRRAALVAAAFPLAVLGNLARMLAIIIAADLGGQAAGNRVHEGGPLGVYSLMPYALAFAGLSLAGHWLRERPAKHGEACGPEPEGGTTWTKPNG
jgi:exosortase